MSFALAQKNNLSVETLSVNRDSKKDQLIITTKVSCVVGKGDSATPRTQISYFVCPDVPTLEVNSILDQSQTDAINRFLGLDVSAEVKDAPVLKMAAPPAEEKIDVIEDTPAPAPVKKTSSKKKLPKKKAPAKKVEAEIVEDVELDLGDDEPSPNIVFDKANKEHLAILKPIIHAALGTDFKEYPEKKNLVLRFLSEVNGKVEVTDSDGKALSPFVDAARKFLTEE